MNNITLKIHVMREAQPKGLSYFLAFVRDDGTYLTPHHSYKLDEILIEGHEYAAFLGVDKPTIEPILDMGLTQDIIDKAYHDARHMIDDISDKVREMRWKRQRGQHANPENS